MVFFHPDFKYLGPTGEAGFIQIGGHESQHSVLSSSVKIHRATGELDFIQIGGHDYRYIRMICLV